jgi:hypothetical protein
MYCPQLLSVQALSFSHVRDFKVVVQASLQCIHNIRIHATLASVERTNTEKRPVRSPVLPNRRTSISALAGSACTQLPEVSADGTSDEKAVATKHLQDPGPDTTS